VASQPLELILARNLVSAITLAAFLVDPDGKLVFFNDAAGELVGRRFEDVGRLRQEDWASEFGPFDEFGKVLPTEEQPLTVALRDGLPTHDRFHMSVRDEELVEVDVSALPLATADGFKGAIVLFWRTESGDPV
jgi:PAS domain-containing protein